MSKMLIALALRPAEVVTKRTCVQYKQDGAKNQALGYTMGDPYRIWGSPISVHIPNDDTLVWIC